MSNDPVGTALHHLGRIARAVEKLAEQKVPRTDEVAKELRQAKAIGQLTVLVGAQKLRALWASTEPTVAAGPHANKSDESPREALTPPWPDYDSLSSSEVVTALSSADSALREATGNYERATRSRRAILDAIGDA